MTFLKIEKFKIGFLKFLEFLKSIPTLSRFTTRLRLWTCRRRNQIFEMYSEKNVNQKTDPSPHPLKFGWLLRFGRLLFGHVPSWNIFFPTALLNQRTSIMQYFLNFHSIRPFFFSFVPLPFYRYRHRDFDEIHR